MLELDFFLAHPEQSWPILREIFYDHFGKAKRNRAHEVLAAWEARGADADGRGGLLKVLITQNIDNPHFNAGSGDQV
jgi:NAD-dependent deacetylase